MGFSSLTYLYQRGAIDILKVILCEDDKEQLDISLDYIRNISEKKKEQCEVRTFLNPDNVTNEDILWSNVAFLDIDFGIGETTGIQLARRMVKIDKWIAVIFITAYKEYAVDAYQLQAIGYLEKPIVRFELENMIDKIIRYIGREPVQNFIEVIHKKKNIIIRQQDIIYIEKILKKTVLSTVSIDIDTYENIRSIEERLDSCFIKINQGVIVNKMYICKIENDIAWMSTGKCFKVSRSHKKRVNTELIE